MFHHRNFFWVTDSVHLVHFKSVCTNFNTNYLFRQIQNNTRQKDGILTKKRSCYGGISPIWLFLRWFSKVFFPHYISVIPFTLQAFQTYDVEKTQSVTRGEFRRVLETYCLPLSSEQFEAVIAKVRWYIQYKLDSPAIMSRQLMGLPVIIRRPSNTSLMIITQCLLCPPTNKVFGISHGISAGPNQS